MSFHVISAVLKHSESELASRLVMFSMAEAASDDGITWLDQETIAQRCRIDTRHVRRCVKSLTEGPELQVRKAQSGRRRFNVYRINLPGVTEPDYERLKKFGIEIHEPFELTTGQIVPSSNADDRTFHAPTTGHFLQENGDDTSYRSEPPREPPGPHEAAGAASAQPPASSESSKTLTPRGSGTRAATERKRNLPFDALVQACPGTDPTVDGGMVAKALKEIRQRCVTEAQSGDPRGQPSEHILFADEHGDPRDNHLLAIEIKHRATLYRQRWPEVELTPTALAKHWTRLLTEKPKGAKLTPGSLLERFNQ